ncbi:MAG: carotenoid biosynthesis protein [Chloroflexota bacterium]
MHTYRLSLAVLGMYIILSVYLIVVTQLDFPFPVWAGFLHPLLALVFVLLHAGKRQGWRLTVLFLAVVVGVTLLVESLGVLTGWPFGRYHYTHRFGSLFLGLVPCVIPVIWLNMVYPSCLMAGMILPPHWNIWKWRVAVAALGGVIMTSWDTVVDPVMVYRGHWVWENEGWYFGIPLQNYLGWWLTTFVVLLLYLWLGNLQSGSFLTTRRFDRLAVYCYVVTGLSSIFGALGAGLYGPAFVGLSSMTLWVLWSLLGRGTARVLASN